MGNEAQGKGMIRRKLRRLRRLRWLCDTLNGTCGIGCVAYPGIVTSWKFECDDDGKVMT